MRFNRAQYHWVFDNGLFDVEHHHELIEGDIVDKMGQKEPHIGLLMRWTAALTQIFGSAFVRTQLPIVVSDDSEPEPDVSIASNHGDTYLASGETTPAADIRLLIEVSVNTLAYDLGIKAMLYARAGIPDYWVSDVANRRLIIHRDPTPEGYATIITLAETQSASPLAAPAVSFAIADFLP